MFFMRWQPWVKLPVCGEFDPTSCDSSIPWGLGLCMDDQFPVKLEYPPLVFGQIDPCWQR
jgi:hypothetical protein